MLRRFAPRNDGWRNGDLTEAAHCPTGSLQHAGKRQLPVVPSCRMRVGLPCRANQDDLSARPASSKRGVRVVTIRGVRDAVAIVLSGALRKTTGRVMDGEIVWSWRRDAGAKLARCNSTSLSDARASRRRRWQESPFTGESTYKPFPHRAGKAGCPARTCGDCRLHFFLQAGHGCEPTPGLPCALSVLRADLKQNSGAMRREEETPRLLLCRPGESRDPYPQSEIVE